MDPSKGRGAPVTKASDGTKPARRAYRAAALIAATLAWVACAPVVPASTPTAPEPALLLSLTPEAAALAEPGPFAVDVHAGQLPSAYGCLVRYEVVTPSIPTGGASGTATGDAASDTNGTIVVWAHGFLRDLASMRGWAVHAASHGLRSVAVSFCNSSAFAGRHQRNAEDLRLVADTVRAKSDDPVAYAGFSAGGLSALLAAASDPHAIAYLGLDAVPSGGLEAVATGWDRPGLLLVGEPSACNADGNARTIAPLVPGTAFVRVPGATHCAFEDPYDWRCEWVCGRMEEGSAASIRAAIRGTVTAWLRNVVTTDRASF